MLARHLGQIVNSLAFQRLIIGLILLAAVVVGLETSPQLMRRYGGVLHTLDWLIIWAFAIEALMKMGQYGRRPWRYFNDPWNCFDFTIVVLCFVPATGQFAAVMRLARVLRVLRLVSAIPRLQILVTSLLRGLPSMGYVGLLLLLLFYVYGVMGVFLFRENDPFHFASLPRALLTLLGVVTLDNWDDAFYPQLFGSDVHPAPGEPHMGANPQAQPVIAVLYFVSFVLVGTIIMLNLVIGVILSSMQEAQTERDRQVLAASRAKDDGITADEELAYLEHQLDDLKRHIHVARAQLERERHDRLRLAAEQQDPGPPDVDDRAFQPARE